MRCSLDIGPGFGFGVRISLMRQTGTVDYPRRHSRYEPIFIVLS
jgi:hypothetical protein